MNKVTVNGKNVYDVDGNNVNDVKILTEIIRLDARFYHILKDGKSYNIEILKSDKASKTIFLKVNGNTYEVQVKDKFDQLMDQMGFSNVRQQKILELKAPMPGLVIDIRVQPGDTIKKGDAVIVLEAMKMENVLKAPGDVTIKSIEVTKGVSVEKNEVLIVFE